MNWIPDRTSCSHPDREPADRPNEGRVEIHDHRKRRRTPQAEGNRPHLRQCLAGDERIRLNPASRRWNSIRSDARCWRKPARGPRPNFCYQFPGAQPASASTRKSPTAFLASASFGRGTSSISMYRRKRTVSFPIPARPSVLPPAQVEDREALPRRQAGAVGRSQPGEIRRAARQDRPGGRRLCREEPLYACRQPGEPR